METIHIAQIDAPIGRMRIASSEVGLAYVELPKAAGCGMRGWLHHNLPNARCVESRERSRFATEQILEYLEGGRTEFDLPLDLRGTEFQRAVWAVLQRIQKYIDQEEAYARSLFRAMLRRCQEGESVSPQAIQIWTNARYRVMAWQMHREWNQSKLYNMRKGRDQ